MTAVSLRMRLFLIILTPLLVISVAAAVWQFRNATNRAEDIFDRGLLSAALAISRDVALSDGDALSPSTRKLMGETSGGDLFYHVFAPDGVFVTGYATPPRPPSPAPAEITEPLFFSATYQGRAVRVLRIQDATTVDGVSGLFTVSVWQDMAVRSTFVREVASRAILVIGVLLVSVGLIVWFGVSLGLRPLLDLQDAIARRTPSDLEPIRRDVPVEARGIVSTLNLLLDRVSRRISSKDEFISNAAHQLRNPIAGVLALAESVENAPTEAAAKSRSRELLQAARDASHLTNQMLSFERAQGSDTEPAGAVFDLVEIVEGAMARLREQAGDRQLRIDLSKPGQPVPVQGDTVMLQEAVLNLLSNALVHGGESMTAIDVVLRLNGPRVFLEIIDDGVGIPPEHHAIALGRFGQANAGPGSGLGLPIASKVMSNHGGSLKILDGDTGTRILVDLPLHQA